ncbi:recombinase family protein [Agrobacterium tumefaciens]|uniref:recombinase family protein n=1 Tax=Agrobacterium tumefaciens TaxID=358 RepID=UPI0015741054|nr:recombinase family protein [Agrobacterium tumefaciens]
MVDKNQCDLDPFFFYRREGRVVSLGYARVSTAEQNLDAQIAALEGAGCHRVYSEKRSGVGDAATRQSLDHLLKALQAGDELVATKLDRIGRSEQHTYNLLAELKAKGVRVRTLDGFDSENTSAVKNLELAVKIAFAAYESRINSERTKAAMAQGKREGRHMGRKPKVTPTVLQSIETLRDKGHTLPFIAEALDLGLTTVKRHLRNQAAGGQ